MPRSQFSKKDKFAVLESKPIKFVENIKEPKHIVLFYEEPEFGKMIEFYFILKGLQKGECCFFIVNKKEDEDFIKQEMEDFGIDIKEFTKKDLLYILTIRDLSEMTDCKISYCGSIIRNPLVNLPLRFRLVGRIIDNIGSIEGMKKELETEEFAEKKFPILNGSIMCPYFVQDIESSKRSEWLVKIIKHHDSVIFAPSLDKGIAFDL